MTTQKQIGAVLAIKEGPTFKYLILHHPDGQWGFVHGIPRPKEGEEQNAVREIYEATHKATDAYDFVPGFKNESLWYDKGEKGAVQTQATYLLAYCRDKDVVLKEHIGFRWLPFDATMRHLSKPDQGLLLKAHQYLSSKVVHIQ